MTQMLRLTLILAFALATAACTKAPEEQGQLNQSQITSRIWRSFGGNEEDIKLHFKFAQEGDTMAQFTLAQRFRVGDGIPQNLKEAIKWYTKAAEQHDDDAQYNLGAMYAHGVGTPQNYAEAHKWYTKAAEQGHAYAQFNLGAMYENGQGVPQNYVIAHKWTILAAMQGDEDAIKNRDIMAKNMTSAQIAEAQRLAALWYEEHNKGN